MLYLTKPFNFAFLQLCLLLELHCIDGWSSCRDSVHEKVIKFTVFFSHLWLIPERKHTLIHIISFAVQMSDHEVIPYVKLPLKPGRVKPTSGQQVEAGSLSWNFYALTECVYFLIHYKKWWVNQKVSHTWKNTKHRGCSFELYSNCLKPLDSPQLGWKIYKIRLFSTSASHPSQVKTV